MGYLVVNGASLTCSMGAATSTMVVLPTNMVNACNQPAANTMDYIPLTNTMSFGTCNSTTNPTTIAATSAAQGVHTPGACIPATTSPWTPGAIGVNIGGMPAVDDSCKLTCSYAGSISVTSAGQTSVQC
ncbi:MAG: DUF4280 domain-containing protein [Lentisphaerales bacterium]|nr:DUF4280 domain-containing protein [Lentisphaerales bacterium]